MKNDISSCNPSKQADHSEPLHHNTLSLPIRKRSILVNGGQNSHGDVESIYSHQSHGNTQCLLHLS